MIPDGSPSLDQRIARLQERGAEVVILGAGINGAGLFRDLCAQGVDCLLIDKNDYGSGTSAAPSRLIHGGLKYLETGEFRLVAESTLERNLLLKNAPHFVRPLPTLIPIFSWTKGIWAALRTLAGSKTAPRSRGALLVKIGLWIYDFYGSRARVMPRHNMVGRAAALRMLAPLTPAVKAVGCYYDAHVTHPERLVLELVKDGLASHDGAAALNATTLAGVKDGALQFSGNGREFAVRPKIVVNAAGPWIDHVNGLLGASTNMISGTKGSHILLDHPELVAALEGRMIYFEADDGRICLVFEHLGRALVGSTDIAADNPDTVRCEDAEIEYFMESLRQLLPGLSFSADQIVYAYSGIRPLPSSNASLPGLISRDHSAPVLEADAARPYPVIALVGGKWTTFRAFAEEVTDLLLSRLGKSRSISTRSLPIGGAEGYPAPGDARDRWIADIAQRSGLCPERVEVLLGRYGALAETIAEAEAEAETAGADTHTVSDYSLAELRWIIRHEDVVHLSDLALRRTDLAIRGLLDREGIETIAGIAATELGWDDMRRGDEIARLGDQLTEIHRVRI